MTSTKCDKNQDVTRGLSPSNDFLNLFLMFSKDVL